MPQSHCELYAHLVFSTQGRVAVLNKALQPRVHGFLAALIREELSAYAVVGGTADHVHLLYKLHKVIPIIDQVRKLKTESSKFIKTLGPSYKSFHWQKGYGMFSVSPAQRRAAEDYIRDQDTHHRIKTFQEEYRAFLRQYAVEFDERYLWD
jgi:REP element-mobilizing transposase RayT